MFGERLKNLRQQRHLSQEKLSKQLNENYETKISKSMISRWENGQTDPRMNYVRIIADYFKVSPDELLGDNNTQKKPIAKDITNEVNNPSDDIFLSYEGMPIPEEELEMIRRILEGRKHNG